VKNLCQSFDILIRKSRFAAANNFMGELNRGIPGNYLHHKKHDPQPLVKNPGIEQKFHNIILPRLMDEDAIHTRKLLFYLKFQKIQKSGTSLLFKSGTYTIRRIGHQLRIFRSNQPRIPES